MSRSRLLLFLLVLVLTLPPGILTWREATIPPVPAATGFSAPQHLDPPETEPGLDARKQGNRREKRRQERKERRERQRQGQNAEQARIEAAVETAPPRIPVLAEVAEPCGPGLIQLPKSGRCTHGPDDPPPGGIDAPDRTPPTAAEARRASASIACDDDGESGFRVQVLYLRSSSGLDRYASSLSSIRTYAAGANAILRDSSIAAGQEMGFTFVTTSDCQIDVDNVAISASAILDFDSTMTALERQGYDRVDRIYLMFADTNAAGICGIGTLWNDDSAGATNANNRGPSYSRADLGCWSAHTAAHELMHNLGGVQYSAPHTTGYGHCIDEYDVMCYRDDSRAPQMQYVCTPQGTFEYLFDCGNDDYFDPLPSPGSYLANNWNTANNWFLTQNAPPDVDLTRPEVTWVAPVGNGQTYLASSGVIPLQADATDASGVAYVEFWLYDEISDDWAYLGEDAAAPYASSVSVSDLGSGLNYVVADAFDTQGNYDEEEIWLQRSGDAVSLVRSAASVKAKKRVTLTATVANPPASGTSLEFRVCRGGSCSWESGQSLGVFTGPTSSTTWKASGKGQVTFLAQGTSEGGTVTSNPATVSVKKAKKKR